MAYTKLNLKNGTVLDENHLAHVESGLSLVASQVDTLMNASSSDYKTMTVVIDLSDSNPDTCCSYEDDALLMSAKSSDWDDFFGHYPVLMKNGVESVVLNPNDYSVDMNGNSVDITSGDAGDVMVAFPRRGLKIITANDKVYISFTDDPNNSDFDYYAHNNLWQFYMGAYDGYIDGDGKLRSLSGKKPAHTITIGKARAAARLNGTGYEQFAFYQLIYLQAMYIMKYKSLNGQTALGWGNVSSRAALTTGTLNDKGLDWGDTSVKTSAMKFAGIENFWGNIWKWVDGLVADSSCNYLTTTTTNFDDYGSGYENTITNSIKNDVGYLSGIIGDSLGGFAMADDGNNGSSTTYFSDGAYARSDCVAYFGGYWTSGASAGPFFLFVYYDASYADARIGARIQKL